MGRGTFAAAINCMDGRTQAPVAAFLRERCSVDYVDMITEAGPVGALSGEGDATVREAIRRRLGISVNGHGSRTVAVVAHHDCAGNPKPKEEQLRQLAASVATVHSWGLDVELLPLWVDEDRTVHLLDPS